MKLTNGGQATSWLMSLALALVLSIGVVSVAYLFVGLMLASAYRTRRPTPSLDTIA